mmetsp:Transcript_16920/g.40969  ORF Transcript_16920/g.40969 Transcript_16920/m.40969 type:complete len:449 (+) Transcript_16920:52-1398(+)
MSHLDPSSSSRHRQEWLKEQRLVASMVKIHDDDDDDGDCNENIFEEFDDIDGGDIFPFCVLFDEDWGGNKDTIETSCHKGQEPFLFGGVDVSFKQQSQHHPQQQLNQQQQRHPEKSVAVYVVIDSRTMDVVYRDYEYFELTVPYIPTFLAFREIDPIERLVNKQKRTNPDVTPHAILVDGNGVLHPRHAGIACFVGTRLSIPTIGIGKSLLYEGGWTREKLASSLDAFLDVVHRSMFDDGDGDVATEFARVIQDKNVNGRIIFLQRLNVDEDEDGSGESGEYVTATTPISQVYATKEEKERRLKMLSDLSSYCSGICIPLTNHVPRHKEVHTIDQDEEEDSIDNDLHLPVKSVKVLGAAMIGHGGGHGPIVAINTNKDKSGKRQLKDVKKRCCCHPGTTQPLFVSVGHDLSLVDAIRITAQLSITKIPEPIRQADLYGRELMRRGNNS